MDWINLTDEHQLTEINELSKTRAQIIFKHSTRCATSSMAKSRLERNVQPAGTDFYYLDLIKFRSLSNKIAVDYAVYHESPQVLIIQNKECIYIESHSAIDMEEIAGQIQQA